MNSFRIDLHSIRNLATRWLVSLSVASAPLAALPRAHALEGLAEPIELTESASLTVDLNILLDRAFYPDVPRKQTGLQPIENELAKADARMMALKAEFDRNLANRISLTVDPDAETALLTNIASYFLAAEKLETLKYLVAKSAIDPSRYTLKLDITDFSQTNLLAQLSYLSTDYSELATLNLIFSQEAGGLGTGFGFSTSLQNDGGRWSLICRLKPDFIKNVETLSMVTNPNTRNVLRMALHFTANQLYDSQAVAYQLLRQPMASLPEPSPALRAEFASLGFKKSQFEQIEAQRLAGARKPILMDKILDAIDAARKNGQGRLLDGEFYGTYYRLAEIPVTAEDIQADVDAAADVERQVLEVSLAALLNLVDLKNIPEQTDYIIHQALLLTARKLFLANFDVMGQLTAADSPAQFKTFAEQKAAAVAAQITGQGRLGPQLQAEAAKIDLKSLATKNRVEFQTRLQDEAAKIQGLVKGDLSLKYLMNSKSSELMGMQLSEFVSGALGPVTQGTYEQGYISYMKFLLTYLTGFTAPGRAMPAKFGEIAALRDQLQWNLSALKGQIDDRLLQVINADGAGRRKDLLDLIHIGELFKFDAYEKLAPGQNPTAETLGLADPGTTDLPLIGFMFHSEKKDYARAIKDDLVSAAPLLGAEVGTDGYKGELWQALAEGQGSREALYALVDTKLGRVLEQTNENFQILDRQLEKFQKEGGTTLASSGEELRTLMGRAAQITVGFKSFTGFGAYYEDVRVELVTPEYWMRQWAGLSDYSDKAFMFIMAYYVLQVASSRLGVATGFAKFTAGLLTPIFGPSLRGLNWVLTGVLGFGISKDLADGFVFEAGHYNTLQKFWACGSEKPCVSLYSDLSQQETIMNKPRSEGVTTIAMLAGFFLAFNGFGKVWGWLARRAKGQAPDIIVKHQKALGLNQNSSLAEADLKAAVEAKYQGALRNYPQQPAYAQIVRLYAREAQASLETMIWKRAKEWSKAQKRFAPALANLGLKPQDLKDLDLLIKRRDSLVNERNLGHISSAQYNRHIYAINQMTEFVAPIAKQMKDSPAYTKFMERVWFSAGNTNYSQIGNLYVHYADRYIRDYADFNTRVLLKPQIVGGRVRILPFRSVVGRKSVDQFLAKLETALKRDPSLSELNPTDLRSWMLQAGGQ